MILFEDKHERCDLAPLKSQLAELGLIAPPDYLELLEMHGNGGNVAGAITVRVKDCPETDMANVIAIHGHGDIPHHIDVVNVIEGLCGDIQLRTTLLPFGWGGFGYFCYDWYPLRRGQIRFWWPQIEHGDSSFFVATNMKQFVELVEMEQELQGLR